MDARPLSADRRIPPPVRYPRLHPLRIPLGRPKAWDLIESLAVEAAEGGDIRDLELSLAIIPARDADEQIGPETKKPGAVAGL